MHIVQATSFNLYKKSYALDDFIVSIAQMRKLRISG